jgi:hypothetical protein
VAERLNQPRLDHAHLDGPGQRPAQVDRRGAPPDDRSRPFLIRSIVMTITNHNGSITLTSFAELGSVIDPETLPSPPEEEVDLEDEAARTQPRQVTPPSDLAGLLAESAAIFTDLETLARQDALARDQAALDLAVRNASCRPARSGARTGTNPADSG